MKKLLLLIIILCVHYNVLAQSKSLNNLIGKWEAVDAENKSGGLEVVDSLQAYLVYGQEKKRIDHYQVDFRKAPIWFDFTLKDEDGINKYKSLIQFVSDDLIQWQVFEDKEVRSVFFTESKGEIIFLRRKKE